jgi:hypothetical protein
MEPLHSILVVRLIAIPLVLVLVGPGTIQAQEREKDAYAPQFLPQLQVSRAPGEIKIDGELDDPGWQEAVPATHFSEHSPGEEIQPPVRTKAFVTYDDKHLYFSAICYAEPGTVRASVCEREQIFNDDNIGFFFDTYGDASRAYIINLNPYGIPYDALWTPGWGEDGNFDLLFESFGKITDSGYQVEAAIPFRSLRFPSRDVQEWRFDFYRHHLREAHYSMSWARYDQNESCWPCRWGTVTGIEGVSPGRGLELIGSVVSTQVGAVVDDDQPTTSFRNNDVMTEMSVGGRFAPTSDVALEATVNPDFSQIESDASQVDVNTTFALSFPERRPFFQEGLEAFRTNFNIVYTRSINDPDLAAKGSAKLGPTSVSLLSGRDVHSPVIVPFEERSEFVARGKSLTNLVAVRQAFGRDNHLRVIATDRRFDGGGSGTLASFDGALRLTRSIKLRGQFIYTYTQEPDNPALTKHFDSLYFDNGRHTTIYDGESFSGTGLLTGINYEGRRANLDVVAYQRTPTYRADNGFQPRNNDRWLRANGSYRFRPQGQVVTEIQPGMEAARIYNFDGIRKDQWVSAWTWMSFPIAQTSVSTNVMLSQERFGGQEFDDIWSVSGSFNSRPGDFAGFGADFNYGDRIARSFLLMGRETNVSGWIDFRPLRRLQGELSARYSRSRNLETGEEFFAGYITRLRLSYQFTRRFSLRLVGEYDDFDNRWSVDPLLTYRINPFSVFYVGSTYDYVRFEDQGPPMDGAVTSLEARQFFVKLQYLFMP